VEWARHCSALAPGAEFDPPLPPLPVPATGLRDGPLPPRHLSRSGVRIRKPRRRCGHLARRRHTPRAAAGVPAQHQLHALARGPHTLGQARRELALDRQHGRLRHARRPVGRMRRRGGEGDAGARARGGRLVRRLRLLPARPAARRRPGGGDARGAAAPRRPRAAPRRARRRRARGGTGGRAQRAAARALPAPRLRLAPAPRLRRRRSRACRSCSSGLATRSCSARCRAASG